jgi:hypothetical protein
MAQLQPSGRLEGSQRLKLAIGVTPRDEQGLDTFVQELYNPASPNYRHYLTPEQFTAKFGPTAQDYQAVINYAKANGLNVTLQHSNRVVLDVEGAVTDIEKALQLTLHTYQHPTEARTFYAPDVEPSVPAGIPMLHIAGLNNYKFPHPRHHHHAVDATSKAGSAPGGQLWGNDFRDAYVPGTALTGAGQSVGLLEFEGYYAKDITAYENAIGMSASSRPQLVVVPLDGGATPADGGDNGEECSIDIEMSVAMAPGLSKVYVFEDGAGGNGNGYFDDIFESMVSYPNILQFSCSWGGSTEVDPTSEVLFKQMASQGQSFYDASGDSGAFVGAVEFPSDSPSITQVGGTTLTDGSAPSYPWESEVVWAWDSGPHVSASDAESSAGGISTYYAIPSWQTGISMAANLGSTTKRNTPDVAANADNCYIYSDDGEQGGGWGGTSCAAPLWAAFTALLNQQAAASGAAPVGFLNPSLYNLGSGSDYFHDITVGNNTWKDSPNEFYATSGYDLCCGLGSMNGLNLIRALVGATTVSSGGQKTGSVTVTISPPSVVNEGALWQVDGGTAEGDGATVTNLSAGSHTLSFTTVSGWKTPLNQTVKITDGVTTEAGGIYVALPAGSVSLTLQTNGDGIIDHAAWPDQLEIGKTYTVTAVPRARNVFSNWTGGTSQPYSVLSSLAAYPFVMQSNLVLQAYFTTNVFLALQGTYRGLFAPTDSDRQQTNSGAFVFSVTTGGAVSGNLNMGGVGVPLTGKFNLAGTAQIISKRAGGKPSLTTTLQLDFTNQSVSGTLTDSAGDFTAQLAGNRNVFNSTDKATAFEGRYTVVIPSANDPTVGPYGTSYGMAIVGPLGGITLAGSLADGTAISESSVVSQDGYWPLYIDLYGGKGSVWGWCLFSNQTVTASAALSWINPGNPAKALYPAGFTNQQATLTGSLYLSSQTLPDGLTATLQGGDLPFPIVVPDLTGNTNNLTLHTNKLTGLISGTFRNPSNAKQAIKVNGVILQGQTNAEGYFLGTNQSGAFLLSSP